MFIRLCLFSILSWGFFSSFYQGDNQSIDEEKIKICRDLGISSYMEYNYEVSISKLNYVLRYKKNDHEAYYIRGLAKIKTDNIIGAKKDLLSAVEYNKTNSDYFAKLGEVFFRMEKYDDAHKALSDAIKLGSKDGLTFYFRAACNKKLGNDYETCADLLRSRELAFNKAEKMYKKHCH